jgi:cytochrome P450
VGHVTTEAALVVANERVVVDFDQHSATYKANSAALGHEIRSRCPVAWTEAHSGFWVVTGREILGDLARRPDLLSNDHDPRGERRGYQGVAMPSPVGQQSRGGFLEMDPPEQLAYRRVLNPQLSPSAVEKWRTMVSELARACLDEVVGSGRIDFVDDLANIVPAVLTMGMLGFPLKDWEIYSDPVHAIVYTPPSSPAYGRVIEQMISMGVRLSEEVERARTNPRPGLVASLVAAQASDPATFNHDDLLGTLILLISGGFDTTTALTAHALQWLGRHPQELARIRADPSLLDSATEEFLRFTTPAQGGARTIAADCEIGGYRFREDDRVWLSYALANRDPEAFPDPDHVVIDRFPNRHAAFGLGVHRCIGSNLARMTFKIMMHEVLSAIPDYTIVEAGVVRYEDVGTINGFQHMPATFAPRAAQGERLERVIGRWQAALDSEAQLEAEPAIAVSD